MKTLFKIILYLEVLKSNLAIFENPFQLGHLFGRVFEIDSEIRQMSIIDNNIEIFHEKVLTFLQEIKVASLLAGYKKYPTPPNAKG